MMIGQVLLSGISCSIPSAAIAWFTVEKMVGKVISLAHATCHMDVFFHQLLMLHLY
jgi:hypothetical protein